MYPAHAMCKVPVSVRKLSYANPSRGRNRVRACLLALSSVLLESSSPRPRATHRRQRCEWRGRKSNIVEASRAFWPGEPVQCVMYHEEVALECLSAEPSS
jgi:hypothetical protein